MKNILTIARKELLDTLRDKRSLMLMIVIPLLVFPIVIQVIKVVSESISEKAENKELVIGYVEGNQNQEYLEMFAELDKGKHSLKAFQDTASMDQAIHGEDADLGLYFMPGFDDQFEGEGTGTVMVFQDFTKTAISSRIKDIQTRVDSATTAQRLTRLSLDQSKVTPTLSVPKNVSTKQETIGKLIGGILPYFFIAFCFMGCMYPSIDLFTGEKERGTIETILTTPVQRWQILIGKMMVVVLAGLMAASLALLGLMLTVKFIGIEDMWPGLGTVVNSILSFKFIAPLILLLIPLAIFFAGVMIPIAINARSFKEAQSVITPLNVVMVLPAMAGFMPGIEYNVVTASIPVINVVMATKEIIADTISWPLLALSFSVLVILASLAVMMSFRKYGEESAVVE